MRAASGETPRAGVCVEVDGHPVAAFFEVERSAPSTWLPEAPLLRVTGSAVMGAVTIKVVDPNAPGWFEKIRARLARKNTER